MSTEFSSSQFSTNVRFKKSNEARQLSLIKQAVAAAYKVSPALAERWVAARFLTPKRHPWPAVEQACLAQAEIGQLYTQDLPDAQWNFRAMRTYRWGQAIRGRVAVMHGWEGRASQFHRFIAAFVAAGYEVIGIDAPGHGASEGNRSSVFHFLTALERLVRNAGGVDAVVAHSMGGGVALHAMANGLAARKAVLIAPNADLTMYSRIVAERLGMSEVQRLALQSRIETRFGMRWDDINGVQRAKAVSQHGLVIHDRQDREIPFSMGESISRAWAGSALLTTTGLGHRRIISDENVVAATLAFVAEK